MIKHEWRECHKSQQANKLVKLLTSAAGITQIASNSNLKKITH